MVLYVSESLSFIGTGLCCRTIRMKKGKLRKALFAQLGEVEGLTAEASKPVDCRFAGHPSVRVWLPFGSHAAQDEYGPKAMRRCCMRLRILNLTRLIWLWMRRIVFAICRFSLYVIG